MASILDESLAAEVTTALLDNAVPLDAVLLRETEGGVDDRGDPLPGVVVAYPCKGWSEDYDAGWRASGIPSTDSRVVVLLHTITIKPAVGDRLDLADEHWRVRAIEGIDPAGATCSLQCYEVSP